MVTAKQVHEIFDNMSAEKKAQIEQDLQREMQRIQDMVDSLRKEGKGLRWTDEGWTIVDTPGINTPVEQPTKRPGPRGPRRPKNIIDAKGRETITMTSDVVTMEIVKGLLSPDTYKLHEDMGIAEHFHRFSKDQGRLIITIRPQEGEGWNEVMAAIHTLGSECVDTFSAVVAMAVELNGVEHIRTSFLASPDDILEICGKKKSHGSFTAGQRADVIKHLKTLSQTKVVATFPGNHRPSKRGRKRKGAVATDSSIIRVEGSLIHLLNFKIGEYNTITGEEIWEKHSIAAGEWITMAPGLNQQTAIMLRRVLAYSAKNQVYQKELGRYLTFMFRVNNHKPGGVFECSMKVLLEGAGLKVPREIGNFREAIEHALACLKRDNVIGEYAPVVDAHPDGQAAIYHHDKGWWDYYATTKWRFHPPDYAREQYRTMLKAPEQPG